MISANIPTSTRKAIYRRDGYRCALCDSTQYLQIHHIIPRGKGGNNEPDNLITLCSKCHGAAHGCIPEGWTMTAEDVEQACIEYVSDMYAEDWSRWNKRVSILSSKKVAGRVPPKACQSWPPRPAVPRAPLCFCLGFGGAARAQSSGPPPSAGPSLRGCRPCAAAALASRRAAPCFGGGRGARPSSRFRALRRAGGGK